MKAHILQVLVIDHDELGAGEAGEALEQANYPNDCISPDVLSHKTYDIGEWKDDHPLNYKKTDALVWLSMNAGAENTK
jgi:hypothetical protein